MKTVKYNWKKFPENKPPKSGRYTVTVSDEFMGTVYRWVYKDVDWSAVHQMWNCRDDSEKFIGGFEGVVAWAEVRYIPYTDDIKEGEVIYS